MIFVNKQLFNVYTTEELSESVEQKDVDPKAINLLTVYKLFIITYSRPNNLTKMT